VNKSGKPWLRFLSRLFAVLVMGGGVFVTAAGALPEKVSVNLFEAYPPTSRMFVEGPLEIRAPFHRIIPVGLNEVAAEGRNVAINSLRGSCRERVASASRLVLASCDREGLSLRHHAGMLKRHYRGVVELSVTPGGMLKIRNVLPAFEYVAAVVGSETFAGWPAEALKAQAVLTQTRLFRYRIEDDLGDTTQSEAYLGCDHDRPEVLNATRAVWGQIVTYDHRPIQSFYHSTCAGRTSAGDEMFGEKAKNLVYLVAHDCAYCSKSPFCVPTKCSLPRTKFERAFGLGTPQIATFDSAKRPLEIVLGNGKRMRGYDFWIKLGKNFGWDKVPGTRFTISSTSNSIDFVSTGAGHGVGLCQWGAAGLARSGKTYRDILQYYFPGTQVE
jgi:stage II sporulation protein D